MSLHVTLARIVSIEADRVYVVVPAWQPKQPVGLKPSSLPSGATVGGWLECEWNPSGRDTESIYLSPIRAVAAPETEPPPWFGR